MVGGPLCNKRKVEGLLIKICLADQYAVSLTCGREDLGRSRPIRRWATCACGLAVAGTSGLAAHGDRLAGVGQNRGSRPRFHSQIAST
jgi:hypothetical protein